MRYFLLILISLVISELYGQGQDKYRVFLRDKAGVVFDAYDYFDGKAINRRLRNYLAICDSTDYPVCQAYVDKITNTGADIHGLSRWLNMIYVVADKIQIDLIKQYDFVVGVERIEESNCVDILSYSIKPDYNAIDDLSFLSRQVRHLHGDAFHKRGFKGKGIRIAIFDGGFPGVNFQSTFEHLFKNNQIVKTYDFVRNREFVYDYNKHGAQVLACIAGIYKNKYVGLAPEAEFLLARTEINTETFAEEKNWLEAAEWADKNGTDIISSSLGYSYHRYFPSQMNGEHSYVAKAAEMAASKGILVVNAMGNDGLNDWQVLSTPADAKNVLAVGAIQPNTGYHANFSSYGPTADFRLKPNVCANGIVMIPHKDKLIKITGTSFATPLISGFAACVLQTDTTQTNAELFKNIEKSASLYPYFDYAHGYGVPDGRYFFKNDTTSEKPRFEIIETENDIIIKVDTNSISKVFKQNNHLFYHIENDKKYLDMFSVIEVNQEKALTLPKNKLNDKILRVHYKGCTLEFEK